MNLVFYPWLFQFESGYRAAQALPTHEEGRVYSVEFTSYAYDFYALPRINWLRHEETVWRSLPPGALVYTRTTDVGWLESSGQAFDVVARFSGIAVSKPRLPFLNPATRSSALQETLLLRVRPAPDSTGP
jgi:hypothetical protein